MKPLVSALCLLLATQIRSQEVEEIKAKDGRTIQGVVIEVGPKQMKVKRADNHVVVIPFELLDQREILKFTSRTFVAEAYDKFTDRYTLKLKEPINLSGQVHLNLIVNYGKNINDSIIFFQFTRTAADWSWLNYHPAYFLRDGERSSPTTKFDSDTTRDGVMEFLHVDLSVKELYSIVSAKKFELKIGTDEFTIGDEAKLYLSAVLGMWCAKGGDLKAATHDAAPKTDK